MKPKAPDAAMPAPSPAPTDAAATATAPEPRAVASGSALTRSDVEELRLALTDLAAARRILDRTE
jgi:hypothetical protein